MSDIRCLLFTVTLLLLGGLDAHAEDGDKVLVIDSYASDYQWSNSIVDGIRLEIKRTHPTTEINVEYLSSELYADPLVWVDRVAMMLNHYKAENLPKAVVLISDEAWMAYRAAKAPHFHQVPVLLCAVKPHSIRIQPYMGKDDSLQLSDFTSTEEAMQDYNATAVIREMNVSGYVKLMDTLIPNIDNYAVITDKRFYGVYNHLLMRDYLRKYRSEYPVLYLDARSVHTDSLLVKLSHISPTTGVLLVSWLTGEAGYEYSKQFIYKRMSSVLRAPTFITNDIGLYTGYFVGGYFYDAQFWGDRTGQMLTRLLSGVPTNFLPLERYCSTQCNINWLAFNRFNLSSDRLPKDTIFVNRPESVFVKYAKQIVFFSVSVLLLLLCLIYMFNSNVKLKRAQKLAQKAIEDVYKSNKSLVDTQESLKIALSKAEAADRMKSAFISNMDHEIRTPLNSIVGFSSLIASMDDREDMEEAAHQIADNSERLLQLVKGIMDLSQLDAGTADFHSERVSLDALLRDLLNVALTRSRPDVPLVFCPPQESLVLMTDPIRVSQVAQILLDNAIKFTFTGSIEVGYYAYDSEWVEVFVRDSGIGIPPEEVGRIFDRFYKHDSYILGVGLGLSVAQQIVEMLGGQMGLSSVPDVGSRFWFRIKR